MGNKKRQKDVYTRKPTSFESVDLEEVRKEEGYTELPINLNVEEARVVDLEPVGWHNFNAPARLMKLTNSGFTAILSGKWYGPRPFVTRGPLKDSYVFTQLHFHWGKTDSSGSEHAVNGKRYPLEMHLMFFKSNYMTQDEAKKHHDGIVIFAYLFRISRKDNTKFNAIVNALSKIKPPNVSKDLEYPFSLSSIVHPVTEDYFFYLGEVRSSYRLICFISRKPLSISSDQLAQFRTLYGARNKPLLENFRSVKSSNGHSVFLVSPDFDKMEAIGVKDRESRREEKQERPRSRGDRGDTGKRSKSKKRDKVARTNESKQEAEEKTDKTEYPQEIFQDDLLTCPFKSGHLEIPSHHVQINSSQNSKPPEVNEDDILPVANLELLNSLPLASNKPETPMLPEPEKIRKLVEAVKPGKLSPMEEPKQAIVMSSSPTPTESVLQKDVSEPLLEESRMFHKEELDEIDEKIRKFREIEEDTDDNLSDNPTPETYSHSRDQQGRYSPGTKQLLAQSSLRPDIPRNESRTGGLQKRRPKRTLGFSNRDAMKHRQNTPCLAVLVQDPGTLRATRAPIKPRHQKMTPVREIFDEDCGKANRENSDISPWSQDKINPCN